MPRFSIRNPYFIVVLCLALAVIGVNSILADAGGSVSAHQSAGSRRGDVLQRHASAGHRSGHHQSAGALLHPGERLDHMESRSLLGVSIIKVYFQPGTNADADVTQLSNLALADLKRLPPGTLPPLVLKFDASSLPVCLVTVKGEGLNETQLHDLAQFQIRNQIAVVNGAEIPAVFGGKYRQAMIYVDPYKLLSRQLSVMDVVDAVNNSNLILPAGDVKIGPTRLLRLLQQPGSKRRRIWTACPSRPWARSGFRSETSARPKTPASCSTTSCASTARSPPTSPS